MVLRGRVRGHAQAKREAVGRRLVVVVRPRAGRRLVVVASVETTLLEVRVHCGRDGGDLVVTVEVRESWGGPRQRRCGDRGCGPTGTTWVKRRTLRALGALQDEVLQDTSKVVTMAGGGKDHSDGGVGRVTARLGQVLRCHWQPASRL